MLAEQDIGRQDAQLRPRSSPAIWAFLVMTFAWTWCLWGTSTFLKSQSPELSKSLFIAAGFGPSLAAVVVVSVTGTTGPGDWLRRCLAWKCRGGWVAVALLAPPLAMLVALAIHFVLGGRLPSFSTVGSVGHVAAQFGLILIIGGPLGEEFGWRGYLLPALAARWKWRRSSLVIGALWGLWHVPLFYIAGTGQSQMPMALFLASAVALSIVFARLSLNAAFSVLPAIVLHWSINAWSLVIPIIPNGGSVRPYVLVMGTLIVIAAIAFFKPGPNAPALHRLPGGQRLE